MGEGFKKVKAGLLRLAKKSQSIFRSVRGKWQDMRAAYRGSKKEKATRQASQDAGGPLVQGKEKEAASPGQADDSQPSNYKQGLQIKWFDNLKMKHKLLMLFFVAAILPMLVMGVITLNRASGEIKDQIIIGHNLYAAESNNQINDYFKERKADAIVLSQAQGLREGLQVYSSFASTAVDKLQAVRGFSRLLSNAAQQYGYTDVYLTSKYGDVVYSTSYDTKELSGLSLFGAHFKEALRGQQSWSNLFHYSFVEDNVLILATPVLSSDGADVVGTVNIIVNQDKLDEFIHAGLDTMGQTAESYLVDAEGLLMTSTKSDTYGMTDALNVTLESEAVQALAPQIEAENFDFRQTISYEGVNGQEVLGTLSVVQVGQQTLGMVTEIDEDEALAGLNSTVQTIVIIMVLVFAFGLSMVVLMSRTITRPISGVTHYAQLLADLDLSVEQKTSGTVRRDEIGSLVTAIGKIHTKLRAMISDVDEAAQAVAASSEELTASAQESSATADEVSKAIMSIAEGSSEQAHSTSQGGKQLKDLSGLIASSHQQLDQVNQNAGDIGRVVSEGEELVRNLTALTETTSQATDKVYDSISKTDESSDEIERASKMIRKISDQTNLLALNAAIEAARAGEHGKGFAVVADEIRKLADQSLSSTKTIDEMVENLQKNASEAVASVKEVRLVLEDQLKSVHSSDEKYQEIAQALGVVNSSLEGLNQVETEMETKQEDVAKRMDQLSLVAESNSSSTQEVAASMQEQTASMSEITRSSENLASLAQRLQGLIEEFKL